MEAGDYVKLVGGPEGQRGQFGTLVRAESKRWQIQLKDTEQKVWRDAADLEKQVKPEKERPRAGSVKDRAMKIDGVEAQNKVGVTPPQKSLSRAGSESKEPQGGAKEGESVSRGSSVKDLAAKFQ
eukprot:TRINITY_DN36590_c0_g1_i1.p1 TRINITY_DN36590_c0_g1~~TRINITY_DN36590_c0_g1_i1.p1  ORF type:complete len:142 (+),score=46.58 TRINITY_DN36590_c0_g1_i1:52-426(+)